MTHVIHGDVSVDKASNWPWREGNAVLLIPHRILTPEEIGGTEAIQPVEGNDDISERKQHTRENEPAGLTHHVSRAAQDTSEQSMPVHIRNVYVKCDKRLFLLRSHVSDVQSTKVGFSAAQGNFYPIRCPKGLLLCRIGSNWINPPFWDRPLHSQKRSV